MNDIFQEAQMVRGIEVTGIQAMAKYAARHLSPGGTMKRGVRAAIKEAWDADPMPYARAYKMRPTWFDGDAEDIGKFQLLAAIEIGKVKDITARVLLAEQWANTTMSYTDVHAAVRDVNKPKAREKKEKHCPNCGEVLP
jgi:hypothetical protein